MRQTEGTSRVEMALEAGVRIRLWIVDSADFAARIIVNAARSVTGFAADFHVSGVTDKPSVRGRFKIGDDILVAFCAALDACEGSARKYRRTHYSHLLQGIRAGRYQQIEWNY